MTNQLISPGVRPRMFDLRGFRRDQLLPSLYLCSPLRFYVEHVVYYCIHKYCPRHGVDVLDVGCGRGDHIFYFSDCQGRYLGIDVLERPDYWQRRAGRKGQLEVEFQLHDATKLAELGRTFNFVISVTMLEHVERDELVVQQIGPVLRPQGHALLVVPSAIARQYLYIGHGYRGYTADTLQSLARRAGLDVLEVWRLGGVGTFLYYPSYVRLYRRRRRFGEWLFRTSLGIATTLDRLLPFAASGYALVGRPRGGD